MAVASLKLPKEIIKRPPNILLKQTSEFSEVKNRKNGMHN
jgi:hypothetical protein